MANSKRLLMNCLLRAVLHVLFTYHAYSFCNDSRKDFRETQVDGIWKSLAMHSNVAMGSEQPIVLVVAKDKNQGNYTTVQSAIDAVPQNNTQLTLILIKPGIYSEQVNIPSDKPYIVMSGTDPNNTVITWNDHAAFRRETYLSATATVSVDASDFIAQYITFQNSYGAGDQAVALRVSGDRSAFYKCNFLGYQDTLFDEKGRHYFKECFIEGAADFICGDGQSFYENCQLHAIPKQYGALTAQKRSSPLETTGYSFVNCTVTGSGLVYLGRAWGRFSRVVFAGTSFDDIIWPQGWHNWNDSSRNKTTFYGEYQCCGRGANRAGRVPWSHLLTYPEALPFLSISFIDGQTWLRNLPFPGF